MNTSKQSEHLLSLYRAAFKEWASQVGGLDQMRQAASENGVLEDAENRTATAEARYRESRNQLTDEMARGAIAEPLS